MLHLIDRPGSRITPACAGRTNFFVDKFKPMGDHPRVCGKNIIIDNVIKFEIGSPPRVREEHISTVRLSIFWGITPACAGRTLLFYI